MLDQIRLAIGFLTLLPVTPDSKFEEKVFARSIKFFTLAGVIFGLINIFCLYLHQFHESKLLTALLIVLGNIFLSGGLHLDGLMDCFDGVAASKKTRKETLTVIKDSRVGAFGSMAGSLLIVSKLVFISQISFESDWIYYSLLFFIVPILSRFMMMVILLFQVSDKEVKAESSSLTIFKKYQKTWLDLISNLLGIKIPVAIYLILFPIPFMKLLEIDYYVIPWMLVAWIVYFWLKYKLKGHNGDSMGAGLELNEALLFLFFIFIK